MNTKRYSYMEENVNQTEKKWQKTKNRIRREKKWQKMQTWNRQKRSGD